MQRGPAVLKREPSRPKSRPRRHRQQATPSADVASPQSIVADVASPQSVGVSTVVIRAPKTRHGPRPEWGKLQHAMVAVYSLGLPVPMNYSKLAEQVNEWLLQEHGKAATTVDRDTVRRAVKELHAQGALDKK
jgi:hypothetical protein